METLIRFLVQQAHNLLGSYGVAIMVVSAVFTLCLHPVYSVAERWQHSEREAQARLKPLVGDLRAVFSGLIFLSYVRTLYRQNHYHPIYAFRAYAVVLIQLLYVLGIYHALANQDFLVGNHFSGLSSLAEPDGLIALAERRLHLLPLLAAGAALIAVLIVAHKLPWKEKLVSIVFYVTVLLAIYDAASAVALYCLVANLVYLARALYLNRPKL